VATEQGPSSLAFKFLAAGAYIAVLFLVVRPLLAPLGRAYEREGRVTPGLFAIVLIFLFASAYTAHQIGINVIVGGFLAGAVLPARKGLYRELAGRLSDFTAVILLPIFLAFSGLNTDFTQLSTDHVAGLALFVVAGVAGKWLGSMVFARMAGMTWAEGNVLGILMNCRGLLVLVVALIGFNQGVISAPMQVGGVVMALVTTMMTGPLFDAFAPAAPADGSATPTDPGSTRVLAGLDDLDDAPVIASLAYGLTGDRRPSEVVLARLLQLSPYDELATGLNDDLVEIERSLRAMHVLAGYAPAGVEVVPLAHSTRDLRREVARLARDRSADVVLVADRDATAVAEHLRDDAAPPLVVGVRPGGFEPREGGTVVAVGDRADVRRIATDVATGRGAEVVVLATSAVTTDHLRDTAVVVTGAGDQEALAGVLAFVPSAVCVVHDGADRPVGTAVAEEA
jgi:vacuolar-type H+-ATPase subunit F/Vma7